MNNYKSTSGFTLRRLLSKTKRSCQGFTLRRLLSKTKRSCQGFTLIESLVSVAIVAVVGTIIAGLITRTFQANTKTQLLGIIKQNGQNALNYIDTTIRSANSIVCVAQSGTPLTADQTLPGIYTGNIIVVKTKTGSTTTYTRIQMSAAAGAGTGSINVDQPTPIYSLDTPPKIDDAVQYQLCNTEVSNGQMLVDTTKGIVVEATTTPPSPLFSLNQAAGSNDVVQIQFALNSQAGITNVESSLATSQLFQTTVVLR